MTKWPVIAAWMTMLGISGLRISQTNITSTSLAGTPDGAVEGESRRRVVARLGDVGQEHSTGSSMVMVFAGPAISFRPA